MSSFEIAFRYAKALLALASSDEDLLAHLKEVDAIASYFQPSASLLYILRSPQWTLEEKNVFLNSCFGKVCSQTIINFMQLLLSRGKIREFPQIAKKYRQLVTDKLGILEVRLVTALPMQEEFKLKLQSALSKEFKKNTQLKDEIDSTLIGGARLIVNHQIADESIKGKLLRLKNHLLRGGISS